MELKAGVVSFHYNAEGEALLTFKVERGFNLKALEEFKDKILRITLKRWRDKRSLDANGYYWKLLSDLARVLSKEKLTSVAYLHNRLLRDLGMLKLIDDKPIPTCFPDTDKTEEYLMEKEYEHYLPTDATFLLSGEPYRIYMQLKGSSEMDSKEFSDLINALVSECKEQGIETLTPDEISHLEGLEGA